MEIAEQVFEYMAQNGLLNGNMFSAIDSTASGLDLDRKIVADAVKQLVREKKVAILGLHPKQTIKDLSKYYESKLFVFDGLGFVDYNGKKYIIEHVGGAGDGDYVTFAPNKKEGTARIGSVKFKAETKVVGTVKLTKEGYVCLAPDYQSFGKALLLPQTAKLKELAGNKIVCVCQPNASGKLEIKSVESVLGLAGDPIVENVAIAEQHGFKKQFSQKVLEYVRQNIPEYVLPEERANRVDLRSKKFVTIDPKTCKDMDDAVCVERTKDGYKFYVAIADVAHYVKKGSVLDIEAEKRSLSAYLGDGVYPMLAEALSNGICSLNPNVDRLAKVVEIEITKDGEITNTDIYNAVINSKHKLCYEEADEIHFCKNGTDKKYADIKDQIDDMFKISDMLLKTRLKRGELRFETDSVDFMLDETKTKVLEIDDTHDSLKSTKIIESFMIAANEAVGQYLIDNEYDTLYRTLYKPTDASFGNLNDVLEMMGVSPVTDDRRSFQRAISQAKVHPLKDFLMIKLLGPMPKAKYQPEKAGHYALATHNYLHFTSPIRRYPDLVTHRVLDCCLAKKQNIYDFTNLVFEGLYSSKREIEQQKADEESVCLMKAMWAENQIGKTFKANVFDITDDGVVVKLDNKVELLIPYGGNKVIKDDKKLFAKFGGKNYQIGDRVDVRIDKADRLKRVTYATDICSKVENTKVDATKKEEVYGL